MYIEEKTAIYNIQGNLPTCLPLRPNHPDRHLSKCIQANRLPPCTGISGAQVQALQAAGACAWN